MFFCSYCTGGALRGRTTHVQIEAVNADVVGKIPRYKRDRSETRSHLNYLHYYQKVYTGKDTAKIPLARRFVPKGVPLHLL